MIQDAGVFILLAIAFLLANLPFLFERVMFVFPARSGKKALGWRLGELGVLYFVAGGIARVLELQAHGDAYPQNWEFYAVTVALFVVFAYPGFVFRYLWHGRRLVRPAGPQ